jgi:CheY-like chemotaxis protein
VPTKILVADDSATMRRVLEMTFAGEDAAVHSVDAAEAALAKAAELTPDIVLADASMPGVDGYELARRIKQNPQLAKTAVIVLASQQAPYDEAKGRSAGVDDHVSKPFDTQALIDRVGQVLARARAVPAGADAAAKPAAAPPAPAARPAPPAAAAAAAAPAGGGANRAVQGTRMGMGAPPSPVQTAPMQPVASKPAQAAQPIPALRPNSPPLAPAPAATAAAPKPAPAAAAVAAAPARPAAAAAVQVATGDLGAKLAHLGLTREQLDGVLALSREVIEQVVWEVVPELAEQLIKEEIKRLTAE